MYIVCNDLLLLSHQGQRTPSTHTPSYIPPKVYLCGCCLPRKGGSNRLGLENLIGLLFSPIKFSTSIKIYNVFINGGKTAISCCSYYTNTNIYYLARNFFDYFLKTEKIFFFFAPQLAFSSYVIFNQQKRTPLLIANKKR